jgi:serine protease Do
LNLFEFDYDLTFMVFFLNAEEQVHGRYGGRDAKGPEARLSPAGLHYAMKAALDTHQSKAKETEAILPKREELKIGDGEIRRKLGLGRCIHCHQVNEIHNAELEKAGKWKADMIWRYPPPDNIGLVLEIDRGNVVERVEPETPASRSGLRAGDIVERLNGVPIHSFADAQYALDRASKTGTCAISWRRDEKTQTGELRLTEGWRKTDISWRPSLQKWVPSPRLWGDDLTVKEKEALGLSAKKLAFRQEDRVQSPAREAGIRGGDIILGIDNRELEMTGKEFYWYVRRNYLAGDRVTIRVLRNGERLNLPMTLQ